nr:hypothetical protein [Acinetobacter oleivorans]
MLKDADFEPDKFREAILKGGFGKDLKNRQRDDRSQRRTAEEERESKDDKKGSKPMFLRPSDLAGDYDFKRALQTTLGLPEGMTRVLTKDDLIAFKHNIETIAENYKGGITVEQVIAFSRQDDIDLANQQIHVAHPVRRKGGLVHFITNASKGSDVDYHHVNVEFQAFDSLIFNPERIKTTTVQNRLSKGKVKFECDCGKFNFWFRYINTVGGTVLGRKEGGFPKLKNPQLTGIACKHLLRVMHFIKSAHGRRYLEQALESDRSKQVDVRYKQNKKDLSRNLSEQMVRANTARNHIVPKVQQEVKKLEQKALQRAKVIAEKAKAVQTTHQAMRKLEVLRKQGILSEDEYQLLSKKLQ